MADEGAVGQLKSELRFLHLVPWNLPACLDEEWEHGAAEATGTASDLTGSTNGNQLSAGMERCLIAEPMWRSLLQTLLVCVGCFEILGLLPGRLLLTQGSTR